MRGITAAAASRLPPRSKTARTVELTLTTIQRVDECQPLRQQLQRRAVIINSAWSGLWIAVVTADRRAQCRHVHAQLVLATGDRLQPVAPERAHAFDHPDPAVRIGRS